MLSVLLIEDNEMNADLAKFLVENAGHECTVAFDGPAGLIALEHKKFDIVLLDIQLPVMDGFTVFKEIRKRGLQVPVIAVSSYAMSGDAEKALAAGMNGYITKPIRAASFMTDVLKLASLQDKVS